jgi:GAF domain-containing protein
MRFKPEWISKQPLIRGIYFKLSRRVTRWLGTDQFAMQVIWAVRYITLLGSAVLLRVYQPGGINLWSLAALFSYFGWLVFFAVFGLHRPNVMLRLPMKYFQAIIDITYLSVFLLLDGGYRSPGQIFYFAPILIMTTLFSRKHIWNVSLIAAAAYLATFCIENTIFTQAWWQNLPGFIPRCAILFIPAISISIEWLGGLRLGPIPGGSRAFQMMLRDIPEGIYIVNSEQQLLYVNPTLQRRHGKNYANLTCQQYLCSSRSICTWCPVFAGIAGVSDPFKTSLIDNRGNKYPAEISHFYLPGGDSAIGFVRDLTLSENRILLDREIQARREREVIRLVSSLADSLESQLSESQGAEAEDSFARRAIEIAHGHLGGDKIGVWLARLTPEGIEILEMSPASEFSASQEEKQLHLEIKWPEVEAFRNGKIVSVVDIEAGISKGTYAPKPNFIQRMKVNQVLCVPVFLDDRPAAVVSAYGRLRKGISEERIQAVQAILNVHAIRLGEVVSAYKAIINEPIRRYRRLEALHEIAQQLASYQDLADLMDYCLKRVKELLNAETTSIFILEGGRLLRRRAIGIPNDWMADECYIVGQNLTGNVIRTNGGRSNFGQPRLVNDVDESKAVNQKYLLEYKKQLPSGQVRHLLAVPLNGRQGTFGVLRAVNRLSAERALEPEGFDKDDQNFLVTLGWMMGIAIELASQHHQERQRYELTRSLFRWATSKDGSPDLSAVAGQVLEKLSGLVSFDSASLQILRDQTLEIVAVQGLPRDLCGLHFPIDPEKHPNAAVLKEGMPIILDNAPSRYPVFTDPKYHVNKIRSWIGVPIIYNGLVLGIVTIDCMERAVYDDDDVENVVNYVRSIAPLIWQAEWTATNETEIRFLRAYFQTLSQAAATTEVNQVFAYLSKAIQETIPCEALLIASQVDEAAPPLVHYFSDQGKVFPEGRLPAALIAEVKNIMRRGAALLDEVSENLPSDTNGVRERSFLSVPFNWDGVTNAGVIALWANRPGMYTRRDLNLLEAFATQASALCSNALLFQKQELSLQAHQETLARYESLEKAALRLSKIDDVDRALKEASEIGLDLLCVEECSIYMIRKFHGSDVALLRASTTIPRALWADYISPISSRPGSGLTGWSIQSGEILNLSREEIAHHKHHSGEYTDHLKYLPSKESHSLLILPLNGFDNTPLGAITFENRRDQRGQRFEEGQVKFAEAFASILGLAIERALLRARFSRMEYGLHYLAGVLQARVTGTADLLLEKPKIPQKGKLYEIIDNIRTKGLYIHEGLWNLMKDIRNDQDVISWGVLPSLKSHAEEFYPNVQVILEPNPLPRLPVVYEYHLYDIGREAIANAARHGGGNENSPVPVSIALITNRDGFKFTIANQGEKCLPEMLEGPNAIGISLMDRLSKRIGAHFEIHPQEMGGVKISVEGEFLGQP